MFLVVGSEDDVVECSRHGLVGLFLVSRDGEGMLATGPTVSDYEGSEWSQCCECTAERAERERRQQQQQQSSQSIIE